MHQLLTNDSQLQGFRGASRGAFYKAKYGSVASTGRLSPLGARGISSTVPQEHNSGRGRGGGGWGGYGGSQTANSSPQSSEELVKILQAINGQPYSMCFPRYRALEMMANGI